MSDIDNGMHWKCISLPRLPRMITLMGAATVLSACGLVPVPGGPGNTAVRTVADMVGTWQARGAGGFALTSDGHFVATAVPSRIFAGTLSDGLTVPDAPGISSGYGTWTIVNDAVGSAIELTPGSGVGPAGGQLIIEGDSGHFVLCVLYQSGPCAVSYTHGH